MRKLPSTAALAVLGAALLACATNDRGEIAPATRAGAGAGATAAARGPAEAAPGDPGPGPARADAAASPAAFPHHAVFSLVDNRLLAHLHRGGGFVAAAGSGAFVRYLRFGLTKHGWALRREVDGRRVAIASGRPFVEVPLAAEQTAPARLRLRVRAPSARKLVVKVNGQGPASVALDKGWQTAEVLLADGSLADGENVVELAGGADGLAVEWLQLGGAAPPIDDAPAAADASGALLLPRGGGLAYYVHVPARGRLVADVAGDGCEVAVRARDHHGTEVTGRLRGVGAALDLGALAGRVVRLDLTGDGCDLARLPRAALAIPGPAPTVARPARPRHVVLWVMDTLRADRVKLFAPSARAEIPNLERLAARGTVFLGAYSQGNESQASHASLFLSMYPARHQIIPVGEHPWKMRDGWTTLGQALKAAGLRTAGITANGFVVAPAGYGRGMDVYTNIMRRDGKRASGYVRGDKVIAEALDAIAPWKDDRFFLFLGTVDTHVPLIAHKPWIDRYDPGPYKGKFATKVTAGAMGVSLMVSRTPPSARDLQRFIAIYDTNVSYQDDLVGRFLAQIEAWGLADDTMIVITADHGEEFWEEGVAGHGASMRESLVHVPLLVYYPPLFPGVAVEEGVDTMDVMPTILDALGLPLPEEVQGESLLPLAQGVGRGYPRPSVTTQFEYAHAMRLAGWKLRVGQKTTKLFDLRSDPEERQVVTDARPLERRFLTDPLSLFLFHRKDWKKTRWGVASNMTAQAAADLD